MHATSDKILVDRRAGVGWLVINNPERRNAISLEMCEALQSAFTDFSSDDQIRCVVMRGAGDKAFASGADISQFEKHRADADAAEAYGKVSRAVREQMIAFEKPLVAMIRGFCMGGGLGIAMTADIRVAAEDAVFGIPAARLGIAYDFLNLCNLTQLIGPAKAKEILLTARRLDARDALAAGLVNTVVSVAELDDAVGDLTERLVDNSPLSMKASKLTINELVKDPDARDLKRVDALWRACFDSQDYAEGRAAFMDKRKPVFSGR